jgi:hypothetical protein
MRTRQLAAWPPIPAAQVPAISQAPLGGGWRYKTLMIEDPPRRFFVYDPAQAVVAINGVVLRPYQQAALDEIAGLGGLFVGVK